jgi:molybdate transport system substrate-binding protein
MSGFLAIGASGLAVAVLLVGTARADEIHAVVTGALTAPFRQIVPAFERATGNKLSIGWGPSSGTTHGAIPVRIQNGEQADVIVMISQGLDGLVKQGLFKPVERVDVAQSGIGVGVRAGTPKPDISSPDALKQSLLNAKSIGYSEGASGVYVSTALLKRLGIADQVAPKLKLVTGELVGQAIARGEVDMGVQQISELRAVEGVDYVGPLPGELQKTDIISAAVSQDAKAPEAARAFVAFLSSPTAIQAISDSGLNIPPKR